MTKLTQSRAYGRDLRQRRARGHCRISGGNSGTPADRSYTGLCRVALSSGLLRLALPIFGAPLASRHVSVADNEGPGNAAEVITNGCPRRIRLLPRRPTDSQCHVFTVMQGPQIACRSTRRPSCGHRSRWLASASRPLARGDIFVAATAWRNSSKQF